MGISTPTMRVLALAEIELGLQLTDSATDGAPRLSNTVTDLVDVLGYKFGLEFVDRAPGLINETAEIPGHAREFARPEDN